MPESESIILMGDFNTTPASRVHSALTATLSDAWIAAAERSGPGATFHGFTGQARQRIDWILFRGLKALRAKTVTTRSDGRFPSDHYPVLVEFGR